MRLSPEHLVIAPILIPFIVGALLLFFDDRERRLKAILSILSVFALFAISMALLRIAHAGSAANEGQIVVYLLGNWPSPFAINLVLDRLSSMMLMLTSVLAIPALIFSLGQ
ncbi:hypothetical protein [Nitrosomonas ureae]|uniref:Multicomponent K+:H+ antiporter subunit D n=1 Tax=Nitrosomonas ureae TaxID=44577 RepID=A0A1H9GM56_9PROT|nr:hypothetical protein [Nitrosomonas ureae]SEQ51202.1 multicomponent K+:H+ antiporter subunit D [Nitrosomonas ureae]